MKLNTPGALFAFGFAVVACQYAWSQDAASTADESSIYPLDQAKEKSSTEDEVIILDEYKVRAQPGLRQTQAESLAKFSTNVLDTPNNVAIIGEDLLNIRGTSTFTDALRLNASMAVNEDALFSAGSRANLRGFPVDVTLRDGYRSTILTTLMAPSVLRS